MFGSHQAVAGKQRHNRVTCVVERVMTTDNKLYNPLLQFNKTSLYYLAFLEDLYNSNIVKINY